MHLVLMGAAVSAVSAVSGGVHVTRANERNQLVAFDAFATYCAWLHGRLEAGPSRLLGVPWPVTPCTSQKS